MMRSFILALTFLTRIPFPGRIADDQETRVQALSYYPLVGMVIGLFLVMFDQLFQGFFSARITNILLLAVLIYLTGGLHLDGFIDTIDGIFSNRKKERIIEIMHDSTVGAFGVVGVFLLLMLKFNLLLELAAPFRGPALILMTTTSRWLIVLALCRYPLAAGSKLARFYKEYLTWRQGVAASILFLLITILVCYWSRLPAYFVLSGLFFNLLLSRAFLAYIINKIAGITGDVLGALLELNEIIFLLMILLMQG